MRPNEFVPVKVSEESGMRRAINAYDAVVDDLRAQNARLYAALRRSFNLIKESGLRSGLTEEEFDGTLKQAGDVLAEVGP